jgi:hypothetical protein
MAFSPRGRISVDLRGLRPALFDLARAQGVSPSDFVRALVAGAQRQPCASLATHVAEDLSLSSGERVRLSLRMSRGDAQALLAAARSAEVSLGTYLAGVAAGIPAITAGRPRLEHLAALVASNSTLATLARNLGRLTSLLSQGSVAEAADYRQLLDRIADEVRDHLATSSAALADLMPRRLGVRERRRNSG